MRARRTANLLLAVLTATTIGFGAAPAHAIVGGDAISSTDLAPGGTWGFLTQVSGDAGLCSGSLVASRWVLTAAHCVGGAMSVRVGDATNSISVSSNVMHPSYDPNTLAFDVALLNLASGAAAAPAVLPGDGAALVSVGTAVDIAGFGATSVTSSTGMGTARSGAAQVVLSTSSNLVMNGAPAGVAGGDSGGPTMSAGVLVGVHSANVPDDPSLPSIDVPVASVVSWIRQVLASAGQAPRVTSGELQTPIDTPIDFPLQITDEQPVSVSAQVTFTATGGSVTGCASDTPPTTCTFTPDAGFEGFGGVEISVTDGTSTGVGGWAITVGDPTPPPPNQLPVITTPRRITTSPGTPVTFDLDVTDPDGTVLTTAALGITTGNGTVTCPGTTFPVVCTYTPGAGFSGTSFIRIVATDGIGEGIRTMFADVVGGGLPPVVPDQQLVVDAGDTFTVTFVAQDDLLGDLGAGDLVASTDDLSDSVHLVDCDTAVVPFTCTYSTDPGVAGHATLTSTFSDGFNETTGVVEVTVQVTERPPTAQLTLETSAWPLTGETIRARVLVTDPEGAPATCRITWGDGTTDRVRVVRGACVATHRYSSAGLMSVTATATDTAGLTSEPATSQLNLTNRRARLDGEVSWRTAGALYRLKVEAEPRSGQVDLRLPDGRRLEGRVTTMAVLDGNVALVVGTGRFDRRTVTFELVVTDGGRGRNAVDAASITIVGSTGTSLLSLTAPPLTGLTLR